MLADSYVGLQLRASQGDDSDVYHPCLPDEVADGIDAQRGCRSENCWPSALKLI
jgi:hypothetical protein